MVEGTKRPGSVKIQGSPVFLHPPKEPSVDLTVDLYTENASEDQLRWIVGGLPLVAGALGDGTANGPDPFGCVMNVLLLASNLRATYLIGKTWKHILWDKSSDQILIEDGQDLIDHEKNILFAINFSILLAAAPPRLFDFKELLLLYKNLFLRVNFMTWWLPTSYHLLPVVYNDCGRPGGGLGQKFKNSAKNFWNRIPSLAPQPAMSKIPVYEITAASILGVMLYLAILPETAAASLSLTINNDGA